MRQESLLKKIASYVTKSQKDAIVITLIAALLPFISWLAPVFVCLIGLKYGPKASFMLLLWAALPTIILGAYFGDVLGIINHLIVSFVVPWCLALALYYSASWLQVLRVVVLIGIVLVAAINILYPEYAQSMIKMVQLSAQNMEQQGIQKSAVVQMVGALKLIRDYLPAIQVSLALSVALLKLMIARAMQAALDNPKGLEKELFVVSERGEMATGVAICGLAVAFDFSILGQLLPIFALPLTFIGLVIVHWYITNPKTFFASWMFAPSCVLLILMIPYSLLGLAIISVVDMFVDFRKRSCPGARLQ